jgi:hypothetical protein
MEDRLEIRRLLEEEIEREEREVGDQWLLQALCVLLFSLGVVDDAPLIWVAKSCNFDTMCGLDVQFLCGAGLLPTKVFLAELATPEAREALSYLTECEQGGDFIDWSPAGYLTYYRRYFRLDS